MDPRLIEIKAHIGELEEFLKSRAYRGWQAARKQALAEVELAIIESDAKNHEEEIEVFKLRGERRLLKDLENQFEGVLADLKEEEANLEAESEKPSEATNKPETNEQV